MTDTPAPADSPNNYMGPIWLAMAPAAFTFLTQLADGSADLKRLADNVGMAWALPWLATTAAALSLVGAIVWFVRRAVSRQKPWALWLRDKLPRMPWDR